VIVSRYFLGYNYGILLGEEKKIMEKFEVRECKETEVVKKLFLEYSQIKGAEGCFVSFDKELADLEAFYSGGALLVGYEAGLPVSCIAIKKLDNKTCEAKRLFIKPEYRGNGYARIMLNTMLDKARELGFSEVTFTTKPSVMQIGYGLYKRMGFEEVSENEGVVAMRMEISN
jgi:GNAT superfamily N-acetyltransferase